ncbi:MAG: hypothetical protein ABWZ40_00335, partial [Caulobacterales bacterium]
SFIDRFLFDWFPPEALGAVRFYFGLGLIFYLNIQFSSLFTIAADGAPFHFTIPIWYFSLLGVDHITPSMIWPVRIAMTLACILFMLGKWTKPAIIAIIICIFYMKGVRDSISGDVHHREVPIIFCLIVFFVSKCERMFSMDAKGKNWPPIEAWEASWPLRAMQIYIVMFYFWALCAKLRLSGLDWFTGGGRIQEMLLSRALRDGMTPDGRVVNLPQAFALSHHPDTVFWIGSLVFVFELLSPLVLFVRDKRLIVFFLIGATIFHLSNYFLMNVQFFFYPFVFVTFFNMFAFHEWAKSKIGLRPRAVPAE